MKILFDFAEENNIPKKVVNEFLEKKKKVETLAELQALPSEFRSNQFWLGELGEFIREYVWYHWGDYPGRYSVVTLKGFIETMEEGLYEEETQDLDITELTVKQLEKLYDETGEKEFKIASILIKNRFDSMLLDW